MESPLLSVFEDMECLESARVTVYDSLDMRINMVRVAEGSSSCYNETFFFLFFFFVQRGATIVYATHIFDGLETWATHLAYIQDGELRRAEKLTEVHELKSSVNLLSVVESWLRYETKSEKKKPTNPPAQNQKTSPLGSSPFMSSRHMAYYR